MNNTIRKGIYFAFATSVISGVSIFLNKFAVAAIKPPLFFTTTKNIVVGLILVSVIIAFRKLPQIRTLQKKDIVRLIMIGLVGGSLPFYLFFTGLASVPAANAAIIQKSLVVWVAILAIPFLKEKFSLLSILAVALLFIGNNYIGGFKGFSFSSGELMIGGATMLWAVENVIAKKALKNIDADIVSAARMGLGAIVLLGATLLTAPSSLTSILSFDTTQWFWLGITSMLLVGYVMIWYRALALAPATTVTAILVFSTVITNVLSAIFVTHTWTEVMGIQVLLISVGVLMTYVSAGRFASQKQEFALSNR